MSDPDFFDFFVEFVSEEATEKFGDHSKFATRVWPEKRNAPGLWRTIRNGRSKTGRRAIDMDDMVRISEVLGIRLSSLVFSVEERMKSYKKNLSSSHGDNQPNYSKAPSSRPVAPSAIN